MEALVARQKHDQSERSTLPEPRAQAPGRVEVLDEALHLAAPVRALALDQIACRGVDRGDAVDLREDRVLRGPEADTVRDRLEQGGISVGLRDRAADREQLGVGVEGLADRVDEI